MSSLDLSAFPPGLVGVIAQDTARFSMFAASLTSLEVPAGTQIRWEIGHQIARSTNALVQTMLASPQAEWLWILGDDHVFSPSTLARLLARDVDIVVPLCLTRMPPYQPVVFSRWLDEGNSMMRWRVRLDDYPEGGLIDVQAAGSAGMLVRRRVFEAMHDPWFEAGGITRVDIGEDLYFCDKARAVGFGVSCDLDVPFGHITSATVWPVKEPEGWTYGFGFPGGLKMVLPPGSWERAQEVADEATAAP